MVKNYSYTYLLPILAEQVYLDKEILSNIQNTYLFTSKNTKGIKLYLLCNFNYKDVNSSKLEDRIISNDLYINSYDVDNKVLYEFNFPKEYIKDYINFKSGKYSKIDFDTKKLILSFWTKLYGHIPSFVTGSLLKIKQVLFKDKKLKLKIEKELSGDDKNSKVVLNDNAELGNKISFEDETYNFKEEKEITLSEIKNLFE